MSLSDSEDEYVVFAANDVRDDAKPLINVAHLPGGPYRPEHILSITKQLDDIGISSFVVGNEALKHFGAKLVQSFCVLAVPLDLHDRAVSLLSDQLDLRSDPEFRPVVFTGPSHRFPAFILQDTSLRILLVPDLAWGLECTPANIELDPKTSLPYPTASHFAQSLLRTRHIAALELFIDGKDSELEWGYENLHFGSHSWKRNTWNRLVREKEKRLPLEKPSRLYSTRFRRRKIQPPTEAA